MRAATLNDFQANLPEMLDRVAEDRLPLTIARDGGRNVVVVSAEDWSGMEETLYLLSSPANAERLNQAIADIRAGKVEMHELIEE